MPGLVTYGETLENALAMAADAIQGYIECLREDGEPIPESDPVSALPVEHQKFAKEGVNTSADNRLRGRPRAS